MKEYKVIKPKLGWRNTTDKLEELLNTYAKQGWIVKTITPHEHTIAHIVFERDKNNNITHYKQHGNLSEKIIR